MDVQILWLFLLANSIEGTKAKLQNLTLASQSRTHGLNFSLIFGLFGIFLTYYGSRNSIKKSYKANKNKSRLYLAQNAIQAKLQPLGMIFMVRPALGVCCQSMDNIIMNRSYSYSEEIDCACFDFGLRNGLAQSQPFTHAGSPAQPLQRKYHHQHASTAYLLNASQKKSLRRPKLQQQPQPDLVMSKHRRGQKSIVNQVSMNITWTGSGGKAKDQVGNIKSQFAAEKENFVNLKVKEPNRDFLKHKQKSSNYQKLAAQEISLKSIIGPSVHFIGEQFNSELEKDGLSSEMQTQIKTTKMNSSVMENSPIGASEFYELLKYSQKMLISNKDIIISKKRTSAMKPESVANFNKKIKNNFLPRQIQSFYDEEPSADESFVVQKFRIGEVPDGSGKIIGFYIPSNFKFKDRLERLDSDSRRDSRRTSKRERFSKRMSNNFTKQ